MEETGTSDIDSHVVGCMVTGGNKLAINVTGSDVWQHKADGNEAYTNLFIGITRRGRLRRVSVTTQGVRVLMFPLKLFKTAWVINV